MASERTRERIVELVRQMRGHTTENGCTAQEAAHFAAKVAEWVEKYQIEDAELAAKEGHSEEIEVCENILRTGKRVHNPGMTFVVNALAQGMCCKCIMMHKGGEAVYGIVGDTTDADYVCQVATQVVPTLQLRGRLEGVEYGYEKAGLVRWTNQYLTGAANEILRRLEAERKERSEVKQAEHLLSTGGDTPTCQHCHCAMKRTGEYRDGQHGWYCQVCRTTVWGLATTALAVITGETIAAAKRAAVKEAFESAYPKTKQSRIGSRTEYIHNAHERGKEAGRKVGLHVEID